MSARNLLRQVPVLLIGDPRETLDFHGGYEIEREPLPDTPPQGSTDAS